MVVHRRVEHPHLPLQHLAHIAAKPDRLTVHNHVGCRLLQRLDVHIQIADGTSAHDVAEVLHRIERVVWFVLSGCVDQAHVVVQVDADVAIKKLDRADVAVSVELLVLVPPLPEETGRRLPQVNGEYPVELFHHLALRLAHFCLRSTLPMHLPER